jgi:hypothetical protein
MRPLRLTDGGAEPTAPPSRQIALDEELSAHRYLEAIEQTVVGYHWEW